MLAERFEAHCTTAEDYDRQRERKLFFYLGVMEALGSLNGMNGPSVQFLCIKMLTEATEEFQNIFNSKRQANETLPT